METCTKSFVIDTDDLDDGGTVEAVIATTGVVDNEKDYTVAGAFGDQDRVIISRWNHDHLQQPPVGIGRIYEDGNEVKFAGTIFDTSAGRDWKTMLKGLGPQPWSYTYSVLGEDNGKSEDGRRRTLTKLKVIEASPVTVPAGVGTRTENIKSDLDCDSEPNPHSAELMEILRSAQAIRKEALSAEPKDC